MGIMKFEGEILKITEISPTVKHFEMSTPDGFDFVAGQFVLSQFNDKEGKLIKRPYSIASGPNIKGHLDLCIKLVPGGPATTHFWELKVGDKVQCTGPMGAYKIKEDSVDKEIIFIGVGTGIAPLRSMIHDRTNKECKEKMTLFFGTRYDNEVLYEEEWNKLKETNPNFDFKYVVSRPRDENYSGDRGHVQDLVRKYVPKDFQGHFYMCGLPAMIEGMQELFKEMGIPEDHVHFEKY